MLAILALLIMVAALVLLPLAPAIAEWQLQRDAAPLAVDRKHDGNVRYFAARFYESLEKALEGPLPDTLENLTRERDFRHPAGFQIVGSSGIPHFSERQLDARMCKERLLSARLLTLPNRFIFRSEIYGGQSIAGGEGNVFRALLAAAELNLGTRSTVLHWAHAGRIYVGRGSELLGRVSADTRIRIDGPCRFVRLNAPRIDFGEPLAEPPESALRIWPALASNDESDRKAYARRTLMDSDAHIAEDTFFEGQLVTYGDASIGMRALVTGSVKSHGEIRVGDNAIVYGALISAKKLTLGRGARVLGPLVAEGEIVLGAGCIIGEEDRPTSLTAPRIRVEAGAVVFGTVWAREHGESFA